MNNSSNTVDSGALQLPTFSTSHSPLKPPIATQPADVNMSAIRQPAGSNMPEHLEASVSSYSDNQPIDPNIWDGVFSSILLIGSKNSLVVMSKTLHTYFSE